MSILDFFNLNRKKPEINQEHNWADIFTGAYTDAFAVRDRTDPFSGNKVPLKVSFGLMPELSRDTFGGVWNYPGLVDIKIEDNYSISFFIAHGHDAEKIVRDVIANICPEGVKIDTL